MFTQIRVIVAAIALSGCFAGALRAFEPPPEISAIAVVDSRLTITGKYFGANPTVKVGDAQLPVVELSETSVVVQLPALETGLYVITVARSGDAPDDHTRTTVLIGAPAAR